MKTVHLGTASVEAVPVPAGIVASRKAKLDRWAASLRRARRSKPPKLPAVPVFPHVSIPTMPAPAPVATLAVRKVVAQPAAVSTVQAPPVVDYQPAPATTSEWSGEHEDQHQSFDEHGDD